MLLLFVVVVCCVLCVVCCLLCVVCWFTWWLVRVGGTRSVGLVITLVGLVAVGGSLVCVVAEGPSLNVLWL